jgi:peptidoglycan/xylan/chitin deacetylase (PgdA/CDA1 family)
MRNGKRLVMHAIEAIGGFRLLRWLNRNKTQILMYHRILDIPAVRAISPELFEQQLAYISQHFRVVPVQTLLAELQSNQHQPNTLSLTFDDGHYDFYENAWPLLKKYQLPATLYITTGFVDKQCWLWPDLIKYLLLTSSESRIELSPLGNLHLDAETINNSWNRIGDYCLTLDVAERNQLIEQLAKATKVGIPAQPPLPFSAVTWEQLREMQTDGLDIASHTFSHPLLNRLNSTDLKYELENSATMIKEHLDITLTGICYPNGRPEDINLDVIRAAQATGYSYGLLARNFPHKATQPFLLGRLSTNQDLTYFKWSLSRHKPESENIPFHY